MKKRIVISSGGTGGHIYPSIALAEKLKDRYPSIEFMFLGGNLIKNPFFLNHSYSFQSVPCSMVSFKKPWQTFLGLSKITSGILQSKKILQDYSPQVVVGFGSFYTFPVLAAAKLCKIPLVLHEANSLPGKVNKIFSPWAAATGVHFPMTKTLLKGNCHEVDMPLRKGYAKNEQERDAALNYFGLDKKKKTVLIFGGSQGAKAINQTIIETFCQLNPLLKESLQFIHLIGKNQPLNFYHSSYRQHQLLACVKEFETRMDLAWKAADYLISRSGASTIAEQLEFEIPSIFIPFPFATDNHQEENAKFIVQTVKGGYCLKESELMPTSLIQLFEKIVGEHSILQSNIRNYKQKSREGDFLKLILQCMDA